MNGWRIDASTRISFTASAISFFCIFEMSMRLHAYLRQLRSARARGGGVAASRRLPAPVPRMALSARRSTL